MVRYREIDLANNIFLEFRISFGLFFDDNNKVRLDINQTHCVKSVQIRTRRNSIFGHFSRSVPFVRDGQSLPN